MSRVADLLERDVAAAAAAIANARAGRRGLAADPNVLDLLERLSPKLLDEVVDDARAVLAVLTAIPPKPRASGALRASDASALGLDLGAGTLCILSRDKGSQPSGVLWALCGGATVLGADEAHRLWDAVINARRPPPNTPPATPDHQEPQP